MESRLSKVNIRRIILGVIIIILVLVGVKAWRVGSAGWALYQDYQQAAALAENPDKLDVTQLPELVHRINMRLSTLENELRPFYGIMRRLDWLPRVGDTIAAAPDLLPMGAALAGVGDVMVAALEPALPAVAAWQADEVETEQVIEAALQALASTPVDFDFARRQMDQALNYRANVDPADLPAAVSDRFAQLDLALPLLDIGVDMAPLAPTLLGALEPQTYLLIAQNDDELRATGGFISSVGTLTVQGGKVITLTFEDSYDVDDFNQPYPDAPPPLERYMLAYLWLFRDANWSPDFPTAAQTMVDLYNISRSTEIDGVIAVDQQALQQVVNVLEPVKIPDWREPATGKNVIRLIRDNWSPEGDFDGWDKEWWEDRKGFVSELVSALRARVEKSPATVDWTYMATVLTQTIAQKHIQVWFTNPEAQTVAQARGWAGRVLPAQSDYLMVVDFNMGFNKVNAVTKTALDYQIDLTQSPPAAGLVITHTNNSRGTNPCQPTPRYGKDYWEIIDRCYWNYLRVYTPEGTQLQETTPHAIPGEYLLTGQAEPARVTVLPPEAEKTIWGTLLLVPHGQTVETTFQYTLPPDVVMAENEWQRYHLTLQKQAGTRANQARVVIQLPANIQETQITPEPVSVTEGQIVFELTLKTDQEIEILFK